MRKNPDGFGNTTRAFIALASLLLPACLSAQILETESARPLRAGQLEIAAGYELQHSREGNETAVPVAFDPRAGGKSFLAPVPIRPTLGVLRDLARGFAEYRLGI